MDFLSNLQRLAIVFALLAISFRLGEIDNTLQAHTEIVREGIATLKCETRAAYADPACPAAEVQP